jgi:predicted O-methyltransferase YrrM
MNKAVVAREHLPEVLQLLKLKGPSAEIGVAMGYFSDILLKNSDISILYSIDPWSTFDNEIYRDADNVSQDQFDRNYNTAVRVLEKHGERSKILRMTSEAASRLFKAETLDFIFIDANHSYGECIKDLELWWPKLRKGGVFAFHDYVNAEIGQTIYGVKKAVDEFTKNKKQKLFVTPSDWPSAYIIKDISYARLLLGILKKGDHKNEHK